MVCDNCYKKPDNGYCPISETNISYRWVTCASFTKGEEYAYTETAQTTQKVEKRQPVKNSTR